MSDLPAIKAEYSIAEIEPVSPQSLARQVKAINAAMDSIMIKDVHYGVIPGTKQPTLLQPGAQKIGLMFRLAPTFQQSIIELGNGHREVRTVCRLTGPNGATVGEGVGIASTMESKHRYRGAELEITDKPVPQEYWKNKDKALLGGSGFVAQKTEVGWFIAKKGEPKENPDIADTYNTVSKMSAKRAHVHAIMVTTGASDMFTQDVEDLPEFSQPAQVQVAEIVTRTYADRSEKTGYALQQKKIDWDNYKYRYHLPVKKDGWDMVAIRDQLKKDGGAFRASEYTDKDGNKRGSPDGDNCWYTNKEYSNIAEYLKPKTVIDVTSVVDDLVDDIPF